MRFRQESTNALSKQCWSRFDAWEFCMWGTIPHAAQHSRPQADACGSTCGDVHFHPSFHSGAACPLAPGAEFLDLYPAAPAFGAGAQCGGLACRQHHENLTQPTTNKQCNMIFGGVVCTPPLRLFIWATSHYGGTRHKTHQANTYRGMQVSHSAGALFRAGLFPHLLQSLPCAAPPHCCDIPHNPWACGAETTSC